LRALVRRWELEAIDAAAAALAWTPGPAGSGLGHHRPFFARKTTLMLEKLRPDDRSGSRRRIEAGGFTDPVASSLFRSSPRLAGCVADDLPQCLRDARARLIPTGLKVEPPLPRLPVNPTKLWFAMPMRVNPGAFMDRSVLEGIPIGVAEGMGDRRFAVGGASRSFIYRPRRMDTRLAIRTCAGAD